MTPPFKKLSTSKKGYVGEEIVKSFLNKKKFKIYRPDNDEEPHLIDLIVLCGWEIVAIDIKCKPKREFFEDTGFDLKDVKKYISLQKTNKIKVAIYFCDEKAKLVYGAFLNDLMKPVKIGGKKYPLTESAGKESVVYFPLVNMKTVKKLTDEECLAIAQYSSRNNRYD